MASLSSTLFLTCVLLLVIGLAIFTRNLVKKDPAYESLCPWWLRLFLYCTGFVLVPPMGLFTGLAVYAFGKNRTAPICKRRRFGLAYLALVHSGGLPRSEFCPNRLPYRFPSVSSGKKVNEACRALAF
jgi:hypothetical protein